MPDAANEPPLQPLNAAVIPRFAEAATFMRTPRMNDATKVDIALVGVPFDLGTGFRTGARQGPAQIREMSRIIRRVNASSQHRAVLVCATSRDMGDTPINPFDLLDSVDEITAFFKNLAQHSIAPIAAGGDHTITLPILRGLYKGEPFGAVHFDAHADTLDTYLGTKINHATPFRRLVEEGILDPKRTIQIGLRGTRFGDDDIQYGYDVGMRIVTMDDFEEMGRKEVIKRMPARLRHRADLHHLRHRRARSRLLHRHRRAGAGRPLHARRPGHHPRPAGHAPDRRRHLRGAAAGRSLRPHGARTPPT